MTVLFASISKSHVNPLLVGQLVCLATAESLLRILRFLELVVQVIFHDLLSVRNEHLDAAPAKCRIVPGPQRPPQRALSRE